MKHSHQGYTFTEIVLETFKLSGLLAVEGDKLTEEHGLSSARWKILGSLARASTPLTVPQIARSMGQSRQAVQRLVDIMCKDGLLHFLDNPNHKRAKLVNLTAKGNDILGKMEEKQIPWAKMHSSYIKENDLEVTLATLKSISRLLSS
ncbi:MarR family winged helix-turn-helix transcriptional regulator [Colwellia asteriadis]|uniref:MarR family winged helix-turn-helix transcriptional regulator n=1 Tax=Colwellia asteriadis TaxID=517723 RepID=A0ABN1LBS7_9GAMM